MLLLVNLKVLPARLEPLPHESKVIFRLDDEQVDYQWL